MMTTKNIFQIIKNYYNGSQKEDDGIHFFNFNISA